MVVWGFGRDLCDSLFIWPVTEQLYSICVHKTAAFLSASVPPFPKFQDSYKHAECRNHTKTKSIFPL